MINQFKNKKILIAGGSGLVGTNLTIKLIELKSKVTSSFYSKIQNKKLKFAYQKFDFTKFKDCMLATKNKDIVFICAVKASGIKNMQENFSVSLIDNIKIRANLIEACKRNKVKKIIWVSSSTVYQPYQKKIRENKLNLNLQPYKIYGGIGWIYRYIENLFLFYQKNYNMDIKIVRTSSIYGPYDNFSENKSHVIPALIKKTLQNNKALKVWGDKKIVRDFVYVDDLIKVMLNMVFNKKINFPINFSYGEGLSIFKLSKIILKISGKNKKIIFNNKSRSSASYRVLDNYKINKLIKIKRTMIEEGLKKTFDWYAKNEK